MIVMGMGRRKRERQASFWIAADSLRGVQHVFYEKLNDVLAAGGFDEFVEQQCEPFYAERLGRPSIPPGVYFRMLLIGYFEGIDSQRGIAWRCSDSRSLARFLGYDLNEPTPDHSSLTIIRQRLPLDVHESVFQFVLKLAEDAKLLTGQVVAVDATTLEANAAMKSIVRRDTGEDWIEYIRRLAAAEGVELKTDEDVRKYDKNRKNKKVPNKQWESATDPDARITKMKDGRTHLAYKSEHVIDLQTEVILAAEDYHADQADTATLTDSLTRAQHNLAEASQHTRDIEKAVADKGYHKAETLADCAELGAFGVKTYIPEPAFKHQRRWGDKPESHKRAVQNNRRRTRRGYSKRLQKKRSERVERSFAHVCKTGGARRSWLRGLEKVNKRYKIVAAARNLGLIMRKLFGFGKPRCWQDGFSLTYFLHSATRQLQTALKRLRQRVRRIRIPIGQRHQAQLAV